MKATLEQRRIIFDKLKYKPTPEQERMHFADIFDDTLREKWVSGGEQAGKSFCTEKEVISRFVEGGIWWIAGSDYANARKEFDYLVEDAHALHLVLERDDVSAPKQGQCIAKLFGGQVMVKTISLKDLHHIGTESPNGIAICEAAQCDFEAIQRCRSRVSAARGWILASGTLEGCLVGSTMIFTTDGLKSLSEMGRFGSGSTPRKRAVQGMHGKAHISRFFRNGVKPTVRLNLSKGFEIDGTLDHKVIVRLPDGSVTWRALDEITLRDLIAIQYGCDLWGENEVDLRLAYNAGVYLAEGCWGYEDRITITTPDEEMMAGFPNFIKHKDGIHWRRTDHDLAAKFKALGIKRTWKAKTKEVPPGILSAKRESVIAFLRGLFDGDGCATTRGRVAYATSSLTLAKQLRMLLLNLGVIASITTRTNWAGGRDFICHDLVICDPAAFRDIVGFGLKRKQDKLTCAKPLKWLRNGMSSGSEFMGRPVCWVKLIDKQYDEAETFDLTVPDGHAYIANGLIVHNSLGFYPELIREYLLPNKQGARTFMMPSWSNLARYPGGRQDAEILRAEALFVPEIFAERYGGEPVTPSRMVIREFRANIHVGDYPFEPTLPVELTIDPGGRFKSGAYSILAIQEWGGIVYCIDEVYVRGLTTEEVILHCQNQRPWWKNVKGGVVDIAATQKATPFDQREERPSDWEIWKAKTNLSLRYQRIEEAGGIERLRTFLKVDPISQKPSLLVNYSCKGLIAECGSGKSPIVGMGPWLRDKVTGKPEDINNHSAKCLYYWLVDMKGFVTVETVGVGKVKSHSLFS